MTDTTATATPTADDAPATGHRVTWMDTTTGRVYSRVVLTDLEALHMIEAATLYANLEPLGCTPAPDWTRYGTGRALADAIAAGRARQTADLIAEWERTARPWRRANSNLTERLQGHARITGAAMPDPGDWEAVAAYVTAARTTA